MNKKEYYQSMLPPKKENEIWSEEQRLALYACGENIIVSAGAGSGKTAVLTERIVQKLLNGEHLKNLIVLTFTSDAATEMRKRIRESIEKKMIDNPNLKLELASIDVSHIQTFDAFALSIVKEYHYLLDVDKNIQIGEESFLKMIREQLLEEILQENYGCCEFESLLKTHTLKGDDNLKESLLEFFQKANEFADTKKYLEDYIDNHFYHDFYKKIEDGLLDILQTCYLNIKTILEEFKKCSIDEYKEYAKLIEQEINHIYPGKTYQDYLNVKNINFPKKPSLRNLNAEEKEESELVTLLASDIKDNLNKITNLTKEPNINSIINNYQKTKDDTKVIIKILLQLNNRYNEYLKENNIYDFINVAKLVVKLFIDNPTVLEHFRKNTTEILVDEYQDTSTIQETLLNLISNNNLYMVGDLKQSIYRFRYAEPTIFKKKYENYCLGEGGFAIDLVKNFRSRSEVLNNINEVFAPVMTDDFGGINYKNNQALKFGLVDYEKKKIIDYNMEALTYDDDELKESGYEKALIEARIIAQDIKNKIESGLMTYDKKTKKLRKATLSDFVILTASRTDYDTYREVFEEYGLPLYVGAKEVYLSTEEIYFLSHVLHLANGFNNPDYASSHERKSLIGFLRSFVIDESDEKISRLLLDGHSFKTDFPLHYESIQKVAKIMINGTIEDVIQTIYDEFMVYQALTKLGNVVTRSNKLNYFKQLATSFSKQNITINDFINYVDYLMDKKKDLEFSSNNQNNNAVSIITIHKSKGLEYPFCYFPSLTKPFNIRDTYGDYLFDSKWGINIPYMEEGLRSSIVKELIKQDYVKDTISESIRLLYVALTRAREKLIIVLPKIKNDSLIPSLNKKNGYRSFNDIYQSIGGIIEPYKKEVNLKEYFITQTKEDTKEFPIDPTPVMFKDLAVTYTDNTLSKASMNIDGLIDEKLETKLEIGNKLHELLELIPIKSYRNYIDIYASKEEKYYLNKFYQSDLIKNLDIINEYHELPFIDDNVNGIIDLVVETSSKMIVIDYKTKTIEKLEYDRQVKIYVNYISKHTNKKVEAYLYSIVDGIFKSVV